MENRLYDRVQRGPGSIATRHCDLDVRFVKRVKASQNMFVVGNKTIKLEAIADHETSKGHATCTMAPQVQTQPLKRWL